jgi:hypothetical protein
MQLGFSPYQTMCFDTDAASTRGDGGLTLCLEAAELFCQTLPEQVLPAYFQQVGATPRSLLSPSLSMLFFFFCRYFPQLALRFCDSAVLSHITTNSSGPLICIVPSSSIS